MTANFFWIMKIQKLTFLFLFFMWQILHKCQKYKNFKTLQIRLYIANHIFILLQIKNYCKLNLLFTQQNNNLNNIPSIELLILFPKWPFSVVCGWLSIFRNTCCDLNDELGCQNCLFTIEKWQKVPFSVGNEAKFV